MVAGISLAAGVAETILLQALTVVPYRAIGTIIADVTVEEQHSDTLTTTKHPVELGASITDHAYKEPAQLTLRVGWSDSGNYDGYVNDVYNELLSLQASAQLQNIYTGKRSYQNMLILNVTTMTDEKSPQTLMVVARCEEIIIVTTQTSTLPPAANQANPQNTQAPVNSGTQQTTPATQQDVSLYGQAGSAAGFPTYQK